MSSWHHQQGRSVVGFNVEAQSNIYFANISQIHFLLGNFNHFLHFEVEARGSLPPPSYAPDQGPDSIWRCHQISIGIPIMEIRQSYLHNGVRQHLYTESGPRPQWFNKPLVYCHQNIIYLQTINFSTSTNSSNVKTSANLMKIDFCIWNYNTNIWFGDKHENLVQQSSRTFPPVRWTVTNGQWVQLLFENFPLSPEREYIDGLVQDCSISSALAMEILQSCTKPSICRIYQQVCERETQFKYRSNEIMFLFTNLFDIKGQGYPQTKIPNL